MLECPVLSCEANFSTHNLFRYHIIEYHGYELKEENLHFENEMDFMVWKEEVQDKEKSTYVQETGSWSLKGGSKRMCYICHWSLKSKSRKHKNSFNENRKRPIKAAGSNKMGKACPSIMVVTVIGEKVRVKYVSTHIGHNCEMSRQPISETDRYKIAGKLAKGIPVTKSLNDVSECSEPSTLRRIDLMGKRDIRNIKRDFNISSSNSESTTSRILSLQSTSGTDNKIDDDIKSTIQTMLKLTKKSVLDCNRKKLLENILTQGLDVLFKGISDTDQLITKKEGNEPSRRVFVVDSNCLKRKATH